MRKAYSGKKRPLELLEAFLQADLRDHAQLVYVGEGYLRTEIEKQPPQLAQGMYTVLGFFNQSQMPLAYLLGDLFCLVSGPDETWGLVVNEASVCGLPIIVSDTVGCGPDMVDKQNGWVVSLDDRDQLPEIFRGKAYNRQDDWPSMGLASKKRVAIHTYDRMTTGVQHALQSIEKEMHGKH